jgi:uncharacterized protein
MSMSMYQASVPIFVQMLSGLSGVLDKAEAHCTEKKIDPAVMLGSRLFPNMWALTKEVVAATDFARNTTARLAGKEPLAIEETEKSFADLKARIKRTVEYVEGFKPAEIDGSEQRVLNFKMGGRDVSFKGQDFLVGFALPNFYFFCTTAYDILRHNGVELAKRDYLGKTPG